MPLSADYCKAARSEPPVCIGLRVRPYSLGHDITLRAYNSSVLSHNPIYSDFILAVFICSRTWGEWSGWKDSWKLPLWLKVWGRCAGRFDIPAEWKKFEAYLIEGRQCPEVNVPDQSREMSGAWESRLKMFIIQKLRFTYEQAMDYPLALAWQDYCADGEESGKVSIMSEADKASVEFIGSDRQRQLVKEAEEAGRRELEEMKRRATQQPAKGN